MADNEENEERRRDKTLQDILNMSIKLSDTENKEIRPTPEMDPERKEFLQQAINSVLENSDEKRLAMITARLLQYKADDVLSEDQLSELSELFEELNYLLDGLDKGKDFDKMGGLKHCLSLLRSDYSSIQWRAADIIANCVQNVPENQYSIIEDKGLEVLLYLLRKTEVDMVRVKCLYALSCLIGGNNAAEKLFVDLKGVDIVLKQFTDENPKIRLKSTFLIRKIIISDSETVKYVKNKVEITQQLVNILKMEHDDPHEVIADMLLHLLDFDNNSLHEYKKMDNLNELFNKRKKELESIDKDKYQELIEMYGKLLKLL